MSIMTIKTLLGKKIKTLRIKKGLTQNQLSDMIGISQRSLSGIEIGKNFLTAETLEKILTSLNIGIDDLFSVNHLNDSGILKEELLEKISNESDERKIKEIYKVVIALLKD